MRVTDQPARNPLYDPSAGSAPRAASSSAAPAATGAAPIGMDESGKGDYFGPLVVAATYVNEENESRLIKLGVRDSKVLTDAQIAPMAASIRRLCLYATVVIAPARYNSLYDKIRNLNRMLAWGHARALEDVLEKVACPLAIADQFGDESYLQNALLEKGRQITLDQHPRAEADVAVAAASILARAEFVKWMADLSRQYGITLPKGASDPAILDTGRAVVRKGGQEALGKVAKLHFKTTRQILA